MFTVTLRLVVMAGLVAAAAACGGGEKIVKTVTKDPKKKEAKQLVIEAREQGGTGKLDQADRTYGEAYATASDAPLPARFDNGSSFRRNSLSDDDAVSAAERFGE